MQFATKRVASGVPGRSWSLATDLYELTMAAAYFANRVTARATFELFVRHMPEGRGFLIAAGLEQALQYLENLHFRDEEISYLRQHPMFQDQPKAFFDYLGTVQFTGEVWALPEGTPVFANEPLLRVTAPIIEAQIVETALLATINFQTLIASKAARCVNAARERSVFEFGSRRAHGTEAALYAARSTYVAGCSGTSNTEAGFRFGIPTFGTIAHSWVMTFDDEVDAFKRYMTTFPRSTTLLIDTYDTVVAAKKIVAAGLRPQAVRLDSGNLNSLSRAVRQVLDEGGLEETKIFASGDLDEWQIAALIAAGAPVDAFGVGTRLATSFDEPALGGVYKLVELEEDHTVRGTLKTSAEKATYPGRKQVWRTTTRGGEFAGDMVGLADEPGPPEALPLLTPVMQGGRPIAPLPELSDIRERARDMIDRLPAPLKRLDGADAYPVYFSERLENARRRLRAVSIGR